MRRQATVADVVVLAGASFAVLGSFLPFLAVGQRDATAWAAEPFLFPLSTLPAALAVAVAAWIVASILGARLPERVLTFDGRQLVGAAAVAATLSMLSWLLVDKGTAQLRGGAVLMAAGTVTMAIGAVLALSGRGLGPITGAERPAGERPKLRVVREDHSEPPDAG